MAVSAHAEPYVNVTVGGEFSPGVFGQISVGNNNPPPPVINPQPVIVGPVMMGAPVVYVYAPPHHMHYWGQYCGYYRACGYPVHFVEMERHGRWWERHAVYLRGPDNYRHYEPSRGYERHEERHYERGNEFRDNRGGGRGESRGEERRDHDDHDRRDERGGHGRR